MTARVAVLVILFFAASVVTAVLLALALWISPQVGLSPGLWALPVATFIGFVGVFFLVRGYVLPPHLAAPAWRATATLTLWMVATLAIWQAAMWVVRPIMRSAGFERGTFVILLGCLLATLLVIERAFGGPRRLPR